VGKILPISSWGLSPFYSKTITGAGRQELPRQMVNVNVRVYCKGGRKISVIK